MYVVINNTAGAKVLQHGIIDAEPVLLEPGKPVEVEDRVIDAIAKSKAGEAHLKDCAIARVKPKDEAPAPAKEPAPAKKEEAAKPK